MKLKVMQAAREDVYRDIVRVPEQYRLDADGKVVPEGFVCKICTPNKSAYTILRGCGNSSELLIYMDERLRNCLSLKKGDEVEVRFETAGFWGQFRWAWNASDPAYRVAARMGLLSVALGLLGLVLGLLSLRGCR
ncbi:MAG: hypothetical protein ABIB41_05295 [Nitrospirota bacterium]